METAKPEPTPAPEALSPSASPPPLTEPVAPATQPAQPDASAETRPPLRLVRSKSDRMIAGVCGGLGKTFNIDPVVLRLALVLATLLGFGVGVVLYLACWALMPVESGAEGAAQG